MYSRIGRTKATHISATARTLCHQPPTATAR